MSSRIIGRYSGGTISPRQTLIMRRSNSSPGSPMAGAPTPRASSAIIVSRISACTSGGYPACGIGYQAHVAHWTVGRLEPAQVAGEVHQAHHQHAQVGIGDRRPQRGGIRFGQVGDHLQDQPKAARNRW